MVALAVAVGGTGVLVAVEGTWVAVGGRFVAVAVGCCSCVALGGGGELVADGAAVAGTWVAVAVAEFGGVAVRDGVVDGTCAMPAGGGELVAEFVAE